MFDKESTNTKAYQVLAGKFLPSLFGKDLFPITFTSFRQRKSLNSFAWNDSGRTPSQEIGKSLCLQRENIDSSLEQEACLFNWGGGK